MINSLGKFIIICLFALTITYSNNYAGFGNWEHNATVIERDGEIVEIIIYPTKEDEKKDLPKTTPDKDLQFKTNPNLKYTF